MSNAVLGHHHHSSSVSEKTQDGSAGHSVTGLIVLAIIVAAFVAALWYGYHDFTTSDQRLSILNAQLEKNIAENKF
ncbi:hypothetical protein [Martelella endophytica]|uniref:hypothetical protein n=1 Tax=Martelella endophytica TaxID=1486262 RepID=UPI000A58F500|nr:hypothetical protein [Martelella endophytica]